MDSKVFVDFHEASEFARIKAKEMGRSIRVVRDGTRYRVILGASSPVSLDSSSHKNDEFLAWCDEQAKIQEGIKSLHIVEGSSWSEGVSSGNYYWDKIEDVHGAARRKKLNEQARLQREEDAKRRSFIMEKREVFEGLSDDELDKKWKNRARSGLAPDEIDVLRSVVRARKGISTKVSRVSTLDICPKCSLSIDTCLCEWDRG